MTSRLPRAFSFATPQQWQSCLMLGVEAQSHGLMTWPGISDASILNRTLSIEIALAFSCDYCLWRESDGQLWRKTCTSEEGEVVESLHPLHNAEGACIDSTHIWTWVKNGIALVDAKGLAVIWRLSTAGTVVALAVNEHGLAVALLDHGGRQELALISKNGDVTSYHELSAEHRVKQIVWAQADTVFILTAEGDALLEFDVRKCAIIRRISLSTLMMCTLGLALSRSGKGPIILLTEQTRDKAKSCVFLDNHGVKLGVVSMPEDTTAVIPSSQQLAVSAGRKFLTFDFTSAGQASTVETSAVIFTPPLSIPQRTDEDGWRQLEIEAYLPNGTTLDIAVAQISGPDDLKIINDSWRTAVTSGRVGSDFLNCVHLSNIAVFQGDTESAQTRYSLQLPYAAPVTLIFRIILHSTLNAPSPAISSMKVAYGGRSMVSMLPAVMLRDDAKSGGFLTSFMGMLDVASGDLDQAVRHLDSKSDVRRADEIWLDEMAGWIGLPWHKRIPIDTKRVLLQAAPAILKSYGARNGLEQVLDATLGALAAEYSILDFTADLDIAATAGGLGNASKLPMLLTGYPTTAAVLGHKAVIGKAELLSANDEPACDDIGSVVLIELATSVSLKNQLNIWLPQVLIQMVPAHVELRIRWAPLNFLLEANEDLEPITVSQSILSNDGHLPARHTTHLNPLLHTECLS